MPTVYVLKCKNKRYYVGKTNRILSDRVVEHFTGNGSEWTRLYNPVKVVECKEDADEFDEDKYTKKYMKLYGIDNVRGGTYTQIVLPEYSMLALKKELCSASDLCFKCNRPGHFAGDCYAKTKADGSAIRNDTLTSKALVPAPASAPAPPDNDKKGGTLSRVFNVFLKVAEAIVKEDADAGKCGRCGRDGHSTKDCYARNHTNGKKL